MTNEHIERLTGSLWMVTKPGGYAHLNQLGRVYREKEVALRHRDFDEVVVELRLADEPEGPASLVGALQDVVHTDPGGVRAGRSVRQVEPPKIDWDALEQAKKDDAAAFANTWGEIKSGLSVEPSGVMGLKVVIDPNMPADQIEMRSGDQVVKAALSASDCNCPTGDWPHNFATETTERMTKGRCIYCGLPE